MPNDCSPIYVVLAAVGPHAAAKPGENRNDIAVRDIFSSIHDAQKAANSLRQGVFKTLAGEPNPTDEYVHRMLAYRDSISVEMRWMHRWSDRR